VTDVVDLNSSTPKLRLLQDLTAHKVYEVPFFNGPPERDVLLQKVIDDHCTCGPRCKHPNVKPGEPHRGNLMVIEQRVWDKRQSEILRDMWRDVPGMSEEDVLHSFRNTYVEDAHECFNRHGRPEMSCIDYKEDHKKIGSPVHTSRNAKRAMMQLSPVFLCDFCPVKTWVQEQVYHQRGLYQ
jgi:hypothetical protein